MTSSQAALLFGLFVLVLLLSWLRERRLTKLARARLWLARSVLDMEKLMLEGKIVNGEICHDHLFAKMQACLYARKIGLNWRLWLLPTEDEKERRRRLKVELEKTNEAAEVLARFVACSFAVYRLSRPIESKCFFLWAMIFGEALHVLFRALTTAIRVHEFAENLKLSWHGNGFMGQFRSAAAAWFVVLMSPSDLLREKYTRNTSLGSEVSGRRRVAV